MATVVLDKECELRFEVEDRMRRLLLELKSGYAEVFGAELVTSKRYEFRCGSKVAVFSWHGCTLELSHRPSVCYVARETPMPVYLNCHVALENMRREAEARGKRGPVTLVAGPPDVGKSSLCHLLLNYAVKCGRRPLYVDLNPDLGHVSVPGTVCALPIERQTLVPEGFGGALPLVLHYGHSSPESNVDHYNVLVATLAKHCFSKIQRSARQKASGIVIDTCGACKDAAYEALVNAARCFQVDVVLVIDHEKLCDQLTNDLPNFVKVIGIPKNGGAVDRTMSQRVDAREQSIRDYFYGRSMRVSPHYHMMKFDQLKLYTLIPKLPQSCLPAGLVLDLSRKLAPCKATVEMHHCLLAISYAEVADENAPLANVMGFVCVTNVDVKRRLVTILSPHSKALPTSKILFVSRVQFFDSI